jgi:ribosome recycling factor
MDQVKKAKGNGLSEDDAKFWEEEVQDMTDQFIKLVDQTLAAKQNEIMQV